MKFRSVVLTGACALGMAAGAADAKTFRYAFQGDLNGLDPYTLNESFTLGALGNVMEALTRRDKDLKIVPGLAERWEVIDPLKWRFYLRKGVKFQGGEDFTADDVVFSLARMQSPNSQIKTRAPATLKAVKVDDFTVDFILATPNPILHAEWDTWYIFSKKWAEANNSVEAHGPASTGLAASALKINGTGPFTIESHQPGVKTVFKPNAKYWGKTGHNLDEVVFQTIKSDATRVAALLTGEIDMIDPVPVQDMERIKSNPTTDTLIGPEGRTIFMNMDSARAELVYSNIKGKNPFKDVRVRKAFYQAIDIEAIKSKVMRNTSVPSALLITPLFAPAAAGEMKRHPYDVAAAKKLMEEAGYKDGFEVEMDCPNDRYDNDEAICQAITAMLSRIGVKSKLNAMPKAKYFEKAGPTQSKPYDSSFNMLGWYPGSGDSWNILANLIGCRDEKGKGSPFNYGGYCNPKIDELAKQILVEGDLKKRDAMIVEAFTIAHDDVGVIPLHQQSIIWGISKKVSMEQRADRAILFHNIQIKD